MSELNLPFDDLPPVQTSQSDEILWSQLEASVTRCLYEACDGVTQALLMTCEWYVTTKAPALTLVIICPDAFTHRRVLNNLTSLGTHLAWFSNYAKIRLFTPSGTDEQFEVPVDEIASYRDFFELEG